MPRILGIVLVSLFIGQAATGQAVSDTLSLAPVPIYSSQIPLRLDPISPWPMELDSAIEKSGALDLGELLQQQGLLHIKDYGPGRLSTLTSRGGSAGQSQVVWNGIPLNAPTLGLLDLSTIPTSNAGRLQFIDRGQGSSVGSGAVTGSLQFLNRPQAPGWQFQNRFGQFNSWLTSGQVHLGETLQSSTSWQWRQSQNNYPYLPGGNTEKIPLPHAATKALDIQQHLYGGKGSFFWRSHAWFQTDQRNIPPTRFQQRSVAQQFSQNLRLNSFVHWQSGDWHWEGTLGLFREALQYRDSIAQINSEAVVWRQFATLKHRARHFGPGLFSNRLILERSHANISAYQQAQQRTQIAWHAQWSTLDITKRFAWAWNHRVEWVEHTGLVWAADLENRWRINPRHLLFLSAHRSYRIPTLHDLFWEPGGNPDLVPETSYEILGAWQGRWNIRKGELAFFLQPYTRLTQNWILWVPGPAFWAPQNVQEVLARGSTQRIAWSFHTGRSTTWNWKVQAQYLYNRATNRKTKSPNDLSLGKQLIYTPIHQGTGIVEGSSGAWSLRWTNEWVGRRFFTTDNSSALDPYYLQHVRLQWAHQQSSWDWRLSLRCQNLLNTEYESVATWAMPGRYFEIGITVQQTFKN